MIRRSVFAAALAAVLTLAACAGLPEPDRSRLPVPVVVEDGSAARRVLNEEVYDVAVEAVDRYFYDRAFNGVDFAAVAAGARGEVVSQPTEAGFYTGLNALLTRLDDAHTSATSPTWTLYQAQARIADARTFGWTTTRVVNTASDEFRIFINGLRADGPAARAGVRKGWRIETVDGQPYDPATSYLDGSHLWGFVDSEGQAHEVRFEAVPLPRELGVAERRPDGVLVLRFLSFDRQVREWLFEQLDQARADPPRAIVLDVRGNSGGDIRETGRIIGAFFVRPIPYAHFAYRPLPPSTFRTRRHPHPWLGPVVVVQSGNSASAAEVLAAAVQEQDRGLVLGQTSAGAVVAARSFRLPDGGELDVGFSSFRTGGGAVIEKVGVTPDIVVEPTYEDITRGQDSVLETAVRKALDLAAD